MVSLKLTQKRGLLGLSLLYFCTAPTLLTYVTAGYYKNNNDIREMASHF